MNLLVLVTGYLFIEYGIVSKGFLTFHVSQLFCHVLWYD